MHGFADPLTKLRKYWQQHWKARQSSEAAAAGGRGFYSSREARGSAKGGHVSFVFFLNWIGILYSKLVSSHQAECRDTTEGLIMITGQHVGQQDIIYVRGFILTVEPLVLIDALQVYIHDYFL